MIHSGFELYGWHLIWIALIECDVEFEYGILIQSAIYEYAAMPFQYAVTWSQYDVV